MSNVFRLFWMHYELSKVHVWNSLYFTKYALSPSMQNYYYPSFALVNFKRFAILKVLWIAFFIVPCAHKEIEWKHLHRFLHVGISNASCSYWKVFHNLREMHDLSFLFKLNYTLFFLFLYEKNLQPHENTSFQEMKVTITN